MIILSDAAYESAASERFFFCFTLIYIRNILSTPHYRTTHDAFSFNWFPMTSGVGTLTVRYQHTLLYVCTGKILNRSGRATVVAMFRRRAARVEDVINFFHSIRRDRKRPTGCA